MIVYFHVELDRHDVLLAEGLLAESYLDTGQRVAFDNGGAPGCCTRISVPAYGKLRAARRWSSPA